VAVVTFSPQTDLIRDVVSHCLGTLLYTAHLLTFTFHPLKSCGQKLKKGFPNHASHILLRAYDHEWGEMGASSYIPSFVII
jgi:hypothetical protein